jgi:putative endonuclease
MFYSYVLKNQQNGKIYIGQTCNLDERLKRHNGILKNRSTSYTSKNKGIWEIIYNEFFETRKEAVKREKELKSYKGREFIKEVLKNKK